MNSYNYYGDQVNQHGRENIGIVKIQASADPQATLRETLTLVMDLRAHVSAADRAIIDESAEILRHGELAEQGTLRRGLTNLIGIATMAGAVGEPVLDAALKVKQIFGL